MRNSKEVKHCCKSMMQSIDDPRVNINYSPRVREYSTYIADSPAQLNFSYCPWCGKKLPESLRDEYFDILEEEFNIKPLDENIPEEFKTDEWWKKRGL